MIKTMNTPSKQTILTWISALRPNQPLTITHDIWAIGDSTEPEAEPDFKQGQIVILESIRAGDEIFYPPFSQEDLAEIEQLLNPDKDGVSIHLREDQDSSRHFSTLALSFQCVIPES